MTESLMQGPRVDIQLVKEWARQAGEIALRHFNKAQASRKTDRTLVTGADYEIEHSLTERIRGTYPEHGIVGEEGTREIRSQFIWVIDPLDGTRAFVAGLPIWGVSIGLLWRGDPWLGLFYLPLLDEWYHSANPASGAFWNDQPIRCPAPDGWDRDSLLGVPADVHLAYDISFPGTVRALGSAAAHLCYVARGTAMAALLDNPGVWDIAGAGAILRAAGGAIRYLDGGEVHMADLLEEGTSSEPMLAAHPSLIERLAPLIQVRRTS